MDNEERLMMKNPNTGSDDVRIRVSIFEPVQKAILEALNEWESLPNSQLVDEVERRTPSALWQDASLRWFTTTVKLHLEATGMLTKTGNPQQLSITDAGFAVLKGKP